MKKFKEKKTKRAIIGICLTIGLLVATTSVLLIVLGISYQWTWNDVLYALNPFAKGNNWAWAIYVAIVGVIMFVVWLTHNGKMSDIDK